MNNQLEERVRDLLADRTGEVVPPAGWEDRVLSAGRRRRIRRRVGSVAGAVAAVILVMSAAGVAFPQLLPDIGPVGTSDKASSVDPRDLPEGERIDHTYATDVGDGSATIVSGKDDWSVEGAVSMRQADGGVVVAESSHGPDGAENLVYRGTDGSTKQLQRGVVYGYAVSDDGRRVAWTTAASDDGELVGTLRLAELPSGRIIESRPVEKTEPPEQREPKVHSFVGDRVALEYPIGSARSPYVWDPAENTITPLLGDSYAGRQGRLVDLSVPGDAVLLRDTKGCLRNVSLTDPQPERWKLCDPDFGPDSDAIRMRISPDGASVVGYSTDGFPEAAVVWVRDLETGQPLWQRTFTRGIDIPSSISARTILSGLRLAGLQWESPDNLLLTFDSPAGQARQQDSGASFGLHELVRCEIRESTCERAPTRTENLVARLADR